jgi:hypothetical protein
MANKLFYQFFFFIFSALLDSIKQTKQSFLGGKGKYSGKNKLNEGVRKMKNLPGLDMSRKTFHLPWESTGSGQVRLLSCEVKQGVFSRGF